MVQIEATEKEPIVDSTNPTLTDIYLYKRYIARQEEQGNFWLISTIFYFILFVVIYIYIDAYVYDKLKYYSSTPLPIEVRAYEKFWSNIWIFRDFVFLRVCTLSSIFPGSLLIGFYYIKSFKKIKNLKDNLRQYQNIYENNLFNKLDSRWSLFRQQLRALTADSARIVFTYPKTYNLVSEQRKKIGSLLSNSPNLYDANEIQYYLDSLQEILKQEQSEQQGQQRWRLVNVAVIISYIASLAWLMIIAKSDIKLQNSMIPFLSIPLWAIVWGALGSLAAILYRFYTSTKRIQFFQESQWLIARPLIGILMSAIAYLAAQAGLIVLGVSSTESTSASQESARRIISITCFLAGFSDRFYLSLIDLLINKAVGNELNNNKDEDKNNNENIINFDFETNDLEPQSLEISLQSKSTGQNEPDLLSTSEANKQDSEIADLSGGVKEL